MEQRPPHLLLDFDDAAEIDWFAPIDDAVMGGASSSRLVQAAPGIAAFTGTVSLENNGGFASVRSRPREWGMAGAVALVLRLRGDGKVYRLNVRTPNTPSAFRFEAPLDLPAGAWHEVEVPFAALRAKAFGRPVPLVGPPDPARVRQIGFMISDRQAGPFRLEIDRVGWR
jgi:NADH dehydrogenase [ubiquinone] 1 alpha subcomplex assembly factor 1